MKRGIAIWTMSKVVMLIFLLLTFGVVVGYVSILNEKVTADSAQAITMQLKSTLNAIVATDALDAILVVNLPIEIPERTSGMYESTDAPLNPYILITKKSTQNNQEYISWAISLTNKTELNDNVYIASSWLVLPKEGAVNNYYLGEDLSANVLRIGSIDNRILYVFEKKTDLSGTASIYLRVCNVQKNNCIGGEP